MAGFSLYSELCDTGKLTTVVPEGTRWSSAVKLRVLGEQHLLLTAAGQLLLVMYRVKEKVVELVEVEREVEDFDTEGNWVYLVKRNGGCVLQGKNGSIGEWKTLYGGGDDFHKICCSNNGLLLAKRTGELYAQGDFGDAMNHETLAPVAALQKSSVLQMSAGIDFAILASQKTSKVHINLLKDTSFDHSYIDGPGLQKYRNWRNVYDQNISLDRKSEPGLMDETEVQAMIDSTYIYGQILHETGVVSLGKVNRGQLGTGDQIKRSSINHLKLFNVSKVVSCCDYSSALSLDGQLFIWGNMNKNHATNWQVDSSLSTPTVNERFRHALDVCCGNFQTYVLTNELLIHEIKSGDKCLDFVSAVGCDIPAETQHYNQELDETPLILCSDNLLVVNHLPINREMLRIYTKEQATVQALTRHLRAHYFQEKVNRPRSMPSYLFYRTCMRLYYLLLLNVKALRRFLFYNDLQCLLPLLLHDCLFFLYRQLLTQYCNSDCIELMHEQDQKVLHIFLENIKNYTDLIKFVVNENRLLDETTETSLLSMESEWMRFSNEQVGEEMEKLTKVTKNFWLNDDNAKWNLLKEPHRRVILDSNEVPLKLMDVNIFSSSPRYVLFSDVLCYMSNGVVIKYPLELVWISTEVNDMQRTRYKEKHRHMLTIITPEETIRCHTLNTSDKSRWLSSLKGQVMRCLKKDVRDKQPLYRIAPYTFSDRHVKYAGLKYQGIWLIGQTDAIGKLWSGDKTYRGEMYLGEITGYGCMTKKLNGTSTIYEGDFYNGKCEGYGKLKTTVNLATHYFRYQGYFKADKYHGFGALTTSNYQYNGEFVGDAKEGFGVIEDSQNGVKYIGLFMNDKKHGSGILVTTNGTYFAGVFANDQLTHASGGLAIFPSGIYYKGELTIDGPCGKGIFYYPEREIEAENFELDDTNTEMSGHTLTGTFAGTWTNVVISTASMAMDQTFNKVPMLDLKITAERKWTTIFSTFHEAVFDTGDMKIIRRMDVKKVWNKVAIFITRAKRKEQLKANSFECRLQEFDDSTAAKFCQTGFQLQNPSTHSLRSSISDSRLSSTTNLSDLSQLDNVSVHSFSSTMGRDDDDFMLNSMYDAKRSQPFRDLEFIPDFCMSYIDGPSLQLLKKYLAEAFRSIHHPLHQLFDKLSNCFYATYSCWKYTPNSILCEPAMNEWISIVSRIYSLVLTVLFPALPKDSAVIDDEPLSYQTLLYPILMTQGIYSALFVMYASKCSKNDEIYRQRILICKRKTEENLILLLDINRDLIPIINHEKYCQAIESLTRFKEKYCPSEMMKHILESFELVDQACKKQERGQDVSADSLLELIILLIIKANLPQLGAEISLLEDLLQNDYGNGYRNTQNDYCLTTLKASYQHIISENFFVNKVFDSASA